MASLFKTNLVKRNRFEVGQAFENFGVGTQLKIIFGGVYETGIAVGLPYFVGGIFPVAADDLAGTDQHVVFREAVARLSALNGPITALKEILVPIDFSDCSKYALRYAVAFAAQFEARITLLAVVQDHGRLRSALMGRRLN